MDGGSCFSSSVHGGYLWLSPLHRRHDRLLCGRREYERVPGMRLAIAFGASSVVVWLIGPIVKAAGFTTLLWVMAGMACITFADQSVAGSA